MTHLTLNIEQQQQPWSGFLNEQLCEKDVPDKFLLLPVTLTAINEQSHWHKFLKREINYIKKSTNVHIDINLQETFIHRLLDIVSEYDDP